MGRSSFGGKGEKTLPGTSCQRRWALQGTEEQNPKAARVLLSERDQNLTWVLRLAAQGYQQPWEAGRAAGGRHVLSLERGRTSWLRTWGRRGPGWPDLLVF